MRKWTRTIITVASGIALVVAIAYAVDYYRKATQPASIDPCIANLKMLAGATDIWAVERRKTTNDIPTWADLVPVYFSSQPTCYQGGAYTLVPVGQRPTCTVAGHLLRQ
jgi:hypothetical protein